MIALATEAAREFTGFGEDFSETIADQTRFASKFISKPIQTKGIDLFRGMTWVEMEQSKRAFEMTASRRPAIDKAR